MLFVLVVLICGVIVVPKTNAWTMMTHNRVHQHQNLDVRASTTTTTTTNAFERRFPLLPLSSSLSAAPRSRRVSSSSSFLILRAASNGGDNDEKKKKKNDGGSRSTKTTLADLDAEVGDYEAQEEAAKKTMDRIMLPRRIGSAVSSTITAFAYAFLIATFALNMFGYSLVTNGSLQIVTLEEKAFRDEVVKAQRQQRDESFKQKDQLEKLKQNQQQQLLEQ